MFWCFFQLDLRMNSVVKIFSRRSVITRQKVISIVVFLQDEFEMYYGRNAE